MKKLIVITACLMFATPALAQSIGEKAQSVGEKTGVNSVLSVAPTTADFVKNVAISDLFEIQSSQLAAARGDTAIKPFAAQMIIDHQKTSDELKEIVQGGTVTATLPTQLDSSHQKTLDKLKSLSGADFIKRYRSDQISAHKTAVSLFLRYGNGGDNQALKDWANTTLPALNHHLQMAQALEK